MLSLRTMRTCKKVSAHSLLIHPVYFFYIPLWIFSLLSVVPVHTDTNTIRFPYFMHPYLFTWVHAYLHLFLLLVGTPPPKIGKNRRKNYPLSLFLSFFLQQTTFFVHLLRGRRGKNCINFFFFSLLDKTFFVRSKRVLLHVTFVYV